MPCPLRRMLLLSVCVLAGCETVSPFTATSDYQVGDLDLNDPDGQWVTEVMMLEISRTPRGSFVRVVDDHDRQFLGTLMRVSQHEVQLGNCLCKEVAPSDHGNGQMKLSFIPVQVFEMTTITGYTMFSPPPVDFDPEKLHPSPGDSNVQAIVLRSGRHLPWVDPPEPSSTQNVDSNDVSDRITAALPGSQVSLVDESGQRINGIVVSAGPESLELMNCLIRETLPGADGPAQFKTSHLPFQSFQPSSLESFDIVSPPPPDFSIPEVGVDCEEYIVSEFVFESGRRQAWGKLANATNPAENRVSWLSGFRNR